MTAYWLYCNSDGCRVCDFYTGEDGREINCPACGRPGEIEGQ